MVLPFVCIKRVEKAIGEIWQETEDSEHCYHSWIQFNGSKTHAVCVLSAVAVLMSYQQPSACCGLTCQKTRVLIFHVQNCCGFWSLIVCLREESAVCTLICNVE